jgi:hypothetical protein
VKPQWARLAFGRSLRAHMWREHESKPRFVQSSCGIVVLDEQLRAAVDSPKCKTCERAESSR